ncbi:hypothetical protein HK097_006592 [Rhizophlyctis rosea]|uniref:Zinc/iron permease n=1 Tax=Rhizophlyctis rosea TaxID=64517 RepID=A0AAD5X2R9_9FUNG|nr:hypothetical protein HK097_006592 [Rhizophlyctis rosea]
MSGHDHHHHHDHDHADSPINALLAQFIPSEMQALLLSPQSVAFFLAFMGSLGTVLGGLLVVLLTRITGADPSSPSTAVLIGVLQALSAGVMMYITCFDLIPESVESIGGKSTMTWFFIGVAAFGILEAWILPDDHDHDHDSSKHSSKHSDSETSSTEGKPKSPKKGKKAKKASKELDTLKRDLLRTSTVTFLALTLHNLPEGLGVYLSSLQNPRLGLQLTVAILLHNIPEGMAVAIPFYVATDGNTSKVLWWTLLNGLAEPMGVIIGGAALNQYLSPSFLSKCLATVGGIMACISIHELQPAAVQFAGKGRATIAFFVGMLVCFGALEAVADWFGGHGHSHGGHGHSHAH